jgi:hypothetical protein
MNRRFEFPRAHDADSDLTLFSTDPHSELLRIPKIQALRITKQATMRRPSVLETLLPFLLLPSACVAADATMTTSIAIPECTISNSAAGGIGGFYDLRPDIAAPKDEESGKGHPYKGTQFADYKVNGWDYKRNFTLNICAPVLKRPHDVKGVEERLWKNISAYYTDDDYTYSLG